MLNNKHVHYHAYLLDSHVWVYAYLEGGSTDFVLCLPTWTYLPGRRVEEAR